jgi:peptide-methionine (S)-S-oxide reductase
VRGCPVPKETLFKSFRIRYYMAIITLGAGCFWGPEAKFKKLKGITKTEVGFMGGKQKNPGYYDVVYKNTGHTEVVQLTYDEKKISFEEIIHTYIGLIDPTRKTKDQYQNTIFFHTRKQELYAKKYLRELQKNYEKHIEIKLKKATPFYRAEEYHQNYYGKHKLLGRMLCGI